MPSNKNGIQLSDAANAAIATVISTTGTTPATDQEILDVQNALLEMVYSINPSTKPTPKIRF